jgi:hypothetical protein
LGMTVGSPPSSTAMTEFVVPRSIPTARAMCFTSTKLSDADSILPFDRLGFKSVT